jgi:penicillin-binding protein 1C
VAERTAGRGKVSQLRLVLALALLLAGTAPAWALPSFAEVRAAHEPSDVTLLDRHGAPVQTVRVDFKARRGPWVTLAELSPALREAIVLGEDRRFWEHAGVDWPALASSAWANAWNTRSRGASTVTMQLAGLLDKEAARPAGGRSVAQKLTQIKLARELEERWRKTDILEAYLNQVPMRGELVGVPAAAQALFGKHPSGLDATESAVLAALVRAPNAAPADVARRACALLAAQKSDCMDVAWRVERSFARPPGPWPGEALAPHFARMFKTETLSGGTWRSTLDAGIQRAAVAALRQQLAELKGRQVEDGAVVVLDNRSGEVRAWVGSSGPASAAEEVDAVLARRQPGSTLKPFIYAMAFERGYIGPDSLLQDAPLQMHAGDGLYQPRNYDDAYKGWVPARVALAASLNVPAVRLARAVGVDDLFLRLNAAGLRLRESGGFHGPSLALGSAEVTLLDLTNAYRMLANDGVWSPARWQSGTPAGPDQRVFSAASARQISTILADGTSRAPTFGFDSPLVTRRLAAVKTGTSKDMRDNWCIGYGEEYTVGVWVGNARGGPMHAVSGVTGAAPVWHVILEHLGGARNALHAVAGPAAEQRSPASASHGHLQTAGRPHGIESPSEGSVWMVDPTIPASAQRLVFEGAEGRWLLDGQLIGQGMRVVWIPRPGRHALELHPPGNGPPAKAMFEVRPVAPR